jgi:farnesol dehydrogenase
MPVAVTGGTGFIGRRLVERLVTLGEDVRVLVRPGRTGAFLRIMPVTCVEGDLMEPTSLRILMTGCERLFHLAALVQLWTQDPERFWRVNVKGVRNILDAASEVGVKRVVYTSSIRALGPTNDEIVDERYQCAVRYSQSMYDRTKQMGEELVRAYVRHGGSAVIVNPTAVFGPSERGGRVVSLLRRVAAGQPIFVPGRGQARENYVYLDDVVDGHLLAMKHGEAGERYILGAENLSFNQLLDAVVALVGREPMCIHVPLWTLRGMVWLQEQRFTLTGKEPTIFSAWVDAFRHSWTYSSQKAKQDLGYHARSVSEGIALTWQWLQQRQNLGPETEER